MNGLIDSALYSYPWESLRSAEGYSARMAEKIEFLWSAKDTQESRDAYWEIDNYVVVQGSLYQVAEATLSVLLLMGATAGNRVSLPRIAELIQQIACGEPSEEEVRQGNDKIGDKCKEKCLESIWLFYGWLFHEDIDVRECAALIINSVENNQMRGIRILSLALSTEQVDRVKSVYESVLSRWKSENNLTLGA